MKNSILSLVAVFTVGLSFSFSARASLPNGPEADIVTINGWIAHLNHVFPELKLKGPCVIVGEAMRNGVLKELQLLEDHMIERLQLPDQSLQELACSSPKCGGPGGGGCTTCSLW